jgi:hypothetical protein
MDRHDLILFGCGIDLSVERRNIGRQKSKSASVTANNLIWRRSPIGFSRL